MPTYAHICKACEHKFELEYSMKTDPPTVCPECKVDGQVQRLIYANPGKVILTGKDLINAVGQSGKEYMKDLYTNENTLANFIGENKYNSNELARNRR